MIYPVLLGRRLLADLGPVDASRTFAAQLPPVSVAINHQPSTSASQLTVDG